MLEPPLPNVGHWRKFVPRVFNMPGQATYSRDLIPRKPDVDKFVVLCIGFVAKGLID